MKSKSSLSRSRNRLFFSILSQVQSLPSQPNESKKTISHLFRTTNFYFCLTLDLWLPTHSRCRGYCCLWSHSMTHTHTHTHTHRSPVDKNSARRRHLYLTTYGTRHRHISVPPAGFQTAASTIERPYTNTLNPAATGIS